MPTPYRAVSWLVACVLSGGCFLPNMQSAEITPGWHVSAGAVVVSDQTRPVASVGGQATKSQGADYILLVSPGYGFEGVPLELGLNVGRYGEDLTGGAMGCDSLSCWGAEWPEDGTVDFISPYVKLGTPGGGPAHAAVVAGFDGIGGIASVGVGRLTPHVSIKRSFTLGDPMVNDVPRLLTRYQQPDPVLWAFGIGTRVDGSIPIDIEVGWLRSTYRPTRLTRAELSDFFVGVRVGG